MGASKRLRVIADIRRAESSAGRLPVGDRGRSVVSWPRPAGLQFRSSRRSGSVSDSREHRRGQHRDSRYFRAEASSKRACRSLQHREPESTALAAPNPRPLARFLRTGGIQRTAKDVSRPAARAEKSEAWPGADGSGRRCIHGRRTPGNRIDPKNWRKVTLETANGPADDWRTSPRRRRTIISSLCRMSRASGN